MKVQQHTICKKYSYK